MESKLAEQSPEILLQSFLNKLNLSPEMVTFLRGKLEHVYLKRGESFTEYGKVCKRLGLLFSGLLYAAYRPDDKDDEFVSRFFYQPVNSIVTSFESFHDQKPSDESIIAIEDCFFILSFLSSPRSIIHRAA